MFRCFLFDLLFKQCNCRVWAVNNDLNNKLFGNRNNEDHNERVKLQIEFEPVQAEIASL